MIHLASIAAELVEELVSSSNPKGASPREFYSRVVWGELIPTRCGLLK